MTVGMVIMSETEREIQRESERVSERDLHVCRNLYVYTHTHMPMLLLHVLFQCFHIHSNMGFRGVYLYGLIYINLYMLYTRQTVTPA